MYNLRLRVKGDAKEIYKCLLPELKRESRSKIGVEKKKDFLEINIISDDSSSLRASFNSLTKLLTVYEKMIKV